MVGKKALAVGIAIVVILLVLFYLSPFSKFDFNQCYTPQNMSNSREGELMPTCGNLVFPFPASVLLPPFPFRSRDSEFIDFCRRNIPTIENSCNVTVDTTLIETLSNEDDEYACTYIFNNPRSYISLKKFVEPLTPQETDEIGTYNLNMIYLKDFAVSISSGPFDYAPSVPKFDYKNCADLKARLR